jgi:transcriptional regulator with XRE-family HTH domain
MSQVEKLLGERVAALRREAGLTQAGLAEAIGVATETISRLERGATMPSLARLEDVARALAIDLHELFRFASRPTPRDRALDRLLGLLRGRRAEEIDVLADVAKSLFAKRPPSRR